MTIWKKTASALIALGVAATGLGFAPAALALNPSDTSVQLFKWSWNDIATECTQWLGPQGYGAVQISPPAASKSATGWWDMYQPVNFASLSSRMGTQSELQAMISTCHTAGVRVYADIVVNQMADSSGTATDGSSWNAGTLTYPHFSSSDFHSACNIQPADYNSASGRNNVMLCRLGGLPDLASESSYVQGQITNYLNTLMALGVDGFRIDAAKHQQPSALQAILNSVKSSHPQTNMGESLWVTQEVLPDGEVTRSDYFPTGTLNEFQFTFAMKDIFRGNNGLSLSSIPAVMGTWNNWGGTWGFIPTQNAIIFVDNWDTERNGSSLNASNFTGSSNDTSGTKRYDLANIFMLAQGYGEAQVQSGFRFSNSDQDRPGASPYSNGVAQINVNWDFIHRWADISNMVKFRSAVKGQAQQNWVTGNSNQIAFSRGAVGFVALNNSTSSWSNTFTTGLPAGTYCNVINGLVSGSSCAADSVVVNASGQASISVPANGGTAVPAVAIYTGQRLGTTTDTTAPSVPTGLASSGVSSSAATINWTASTDNSGGSGMSGYIVYRNGTQVGTPNITTFSDSGLSASTNYSYTVKAKDVAGNISAASSALAVTTGGSMTSGCAVTFTIANANTTFGQNLYVVGNQTAIGNWGTGSGFALAIQGSGANVPWAGTVTLPANAAVQYKYIKKNGSAVVWESNQTTSSGNREFTSCASGSQSRSDGNFKN